MKQNYPGRLVGIFCYIYNVYVKPFCYRLLEFFPCKFLFLWDTIHTARKNNLVQYNKRKG